MLDVPYIERNKLKFNILSLQAVCSAIHVNVACLSVGFRQNSRLCVATVVTTFVAEMQMLFSRPLLRVIFFIWEVISEFM